MACKTHPTIKGPIIVPIPLIIRRPLETGTMSSHSKKSLVCGVYKEESRFEVLSNMRADINNKVKFCAMNTAISVPKAPIAARLMIKRGRSIQSVNQPSG